MEKLVGRSIYIDFLIIFKIGQMICGRTNVKPDLVKGVLSSSILNKIYILNISPSFPLYFAVYELFS